jgi:energy-coupling factor transporter transmembrane protein EcfT
MSEMTLQFIDNNSIINRTDAISKLAWVLAVVILTFQFNTNEARALMLGALLFVAIFLARVPLITIIRTSHSFSGLRCCWACSTFSSHPASRSLCWVRCMAAPQD